jgi:methionyl-tRNA formyltransferase
MLTVAFYGARPLGFLVRDIVQHDPRITLIGSRFDCTGWWGSVSRDEDHWPIRQTRDELDALRPDLIVSCLTSHIFTADEISRTPLGIINLHPAPLPTLRGCNSYAHAIIDNRKRYGVSLHYVDEGIDTGPLIAEWGLPIRSHETGRSLHDRAQGVALSMFETEWQAIVTAGLRGERVGATPQTAMVNVTPAYHRRDSLDAYRDLSHFPLPDRERIQRALTFHPFDTPPMV